ncbi:hypothetical protein FQA39_LY13738 [Lamprigera yunnana]|nr:hypothetical protein FQA39_LY13738 [Lamprigera yunnana]
MGIRKVSYYKRKQTKRALTLKKKKGMRIRSFELLLSYDAAFYVHMGKHSKKTLPLSVKRKSRRAAAKRRWKEHEKSTMPRSVVKRKRNKASMAQRKRWARAKILHAIGSSDVEEDAHVEYFENKLQRRFEPEIFTPVVPKEAETPSCSQVIDTTIIKDEIQETFIKQENCMLPIKNEFDESYMEIENYTIPIENEVENNYFGSTKCFIPTSQSTSRKCFRIRNVKSLKFDESIQEVKADILIIRQIDPCLKSNGTAHHTEKYELINRTIAPQLVVRRGQFFEIVLTLSRRYNPDKDAISFIFTVPDEYNPSFGQGTLVPVPLLKQFNTYAPWNAIIDSFDDTNVKVHITPAADCIVGKWRMEVDTKIIDGDAYSYSWETDIYILFNPWCKDDQVFLKDEEWRNEAVLEDVGLIYRGTFNRIRPCIWKYQQFEKQVLECSLYLIKHIGKINGHFRSDPVMIARALSAAVNSVDDNGAVIGNWSEDFTGGTPPTEWIGSMEILQKYYKKKKPVKYGQCWVFSGVLTTICRAIGIPARTITNYKSAHDTQGSLTVDYFMDENGKILEDLNSDSIWNFHVWNEVWMQRPDLGNAYAGWQAIDATPQERSGDIYRVGPSSTVAVKLGEVKRPYDTGFLFAEVNADKVFWRYSGPTHPLKLLGKDIHSIGKLVITKSAGKWVYDDITATYKYSENAEEERETMFKALRQSENMFSRYYLNDDFNDIVFRLETRDDIKIGQPFAVYLVMKNVNKTRDYVVVVTIRIDAVAYTGKVGKNIKQNRFKVLVKADAPLEVQASATYSEYRKSLMDQAAFNVTCLASVEDTEFEYYTQDEFRVRKPDIKIMLLSHPLQNQEVPVDVYLENPLPIALRRCEFTIDAPGLDKKLTLKVKDTIPPGGKALVKFKFVPPSVGSQTIAAKFVSPDLEDVDGFLNFVVEKIKLENGDS